MRRLLAALLAVGALALVPAAPAVAQVPAQAPGCDATSATLTWGFKESFRAYIDGSIANGEWTPADGATYDTPSFGFALDAGRLDPRVPAGSVSYDGSVRFTGHGGILDTTIANPVLLVRPEGVGILLLDVSGVTMDGDEVSVTEASFLDVDLSGQDLTPGDDGIITIDEAPTTLTAEGAEAFPNYEAGTEFDPISATIDVGDCDLEGQPIGTDSVESGPDTDLVALIVGGAVIALLAVILLAFPRARRNR